MKRSLAGLLAGATLLAAAPAVAQDLVFDLHNRSSVVLLELYVSPAHQNTWGADILGVDVLRPGESAAVTIADGETTCVYDMGFKGENGEELVEEGIDLCSLGSYTLQ
ncbi:hypothetical protein [Caenispirillum bisanense]|uniref:hypothetical protein n=1 Tax=Caenispirillum bisanense TaxID=414052 RepID=UPI0031E04D5D